MRALFLSLMVALGLGLCSWGSLNLLALAGAYRSTDLALTEQPASFRAWLLDVVAGTRSDPHLQNDRSATSRDALGQSSECRRCHGRS